MANSVCKKVWSGDTGYGARYSYMCANPAKGGAVKAADVKQPDAVTGPLKATSSYKKGSCDVYVGDRGFVGVMISRLWVECNSK
jgi:hypothetical protein